MNRKTVIILKTVTAICIILICGLIFHFSEMDGNKSSEISGKILNHQIKKFFPKIETYQPDIRQNITEMLHSFIRKSAHFIIFSALGFFTAALSFLYNNRYLKMYVYPALFCLFYAATDEIHQLFIALRKASVSDVGIDFFGSLFGMAIFTLLIFLIKKLYLRFKRNL